jgi:thymidylate kinase
MDVHAADNLYDSFIKYQSELGLMFDQLAQEYDFVTINAGRPVMEVFADLKAKIRDLLEDEQPIFSETL